uniref:Uncharacterized protein n=1 Tax=Utricularia reniformis TaxID=192314 RepID=A0A1Y0B0W1_9LAMI|nr:hypothetical protein AEK19_MT0775 [Utricularia reniformis]ART31018.1 hypothetical protein AEK19_MT0775 [Utricularia reniformis]
MLFFLVMILGLKEKGPPSTKEGNSVLAPRKQLTQFDFGNKSYLPREE